LIFEQSFQLETATVSLHGHKLSQRLRLLLAMLTI